MNRFLLLSILMLSFPFYARASEVTKPNQTVPQTKASTATELKSLAAWLGNWKLTCKSGTKITLTAEAKNGVPVVKSTYGDVSAATDSPANDTQVQQIQVADVITLLVSGPDSDEGSALVVIPGSLSETIGPRAEGFPVLKRNSSATALLYGDSVGDAYRTDTLDCELK